MSQETTIYIVNLIIGTILAALMTQHWRRDGHAHGLRLWSLAAWVLASADLLFALRPVMPYVAGRFFPTLMVTFGHGALLLAAQRTADAPLRARMVSAVGAMHALALALFLVFDADSGWRTAVNGIIWGGLSLAAGLALWRGPAPIRKAFAIPALVFLWQATFHAVRTMLATGVAIAPATGAAEGSALVQLLGDFEVSLFMVALFVSVLAAHLRDALTRVRQLSSLLPICAWCHKVRAEDGQWSQLEQYLSAREITVTHGMCESCSEKQAAIED
jgi:hypothetical protein